MFLDQSRKKFIIFYLTFFFLIYIFIYFGLKYFSQKNFNEESLQHLISGKSIFRDTTDKLCNYQILGEPDVQKNYIKINFWCKDNSKARSTFSLIAFNDKTFQGILNEYSRIVGFDPNILKENNWYCTLNDIEITPNSSNMIINPASTIDCFETKGLLKHD